MRLRDVIKAARRLRATVGSERGKLFVRRNRRGVRIIAIADEVARVVIHLDDAGVDKLVARLQALRGGRKALARTR